MLEKIVFLILSAITLGSALVVVTQRSLFRAALFLVVRQLGHGIVGTSKLKRTYSLKIFTFQKDLRSSKPIQGPRGHDGSHMGMSLQPLLSVFNEFK